MVEVSERGVKEEDIKLDLGLSIGGTSFRRSERLKLDTRENEYQTVAAVRSSSTMSPPTAFSEPESSVLDPQAKREMQALRRQEAKRKREEKKTRALIGEQQQPPAKKNGDLSQQDNVVNEQVEHHHYPVGPVQYPYAPVQLVPYSNGFAYPCVVPCWAPNGGGDGGFRQFQDLGNNGCNPEQNGITASLNNGSPICSSSTVSEHYSTASHEGGSSDTRSHSSRFNGSIGKNISQSDHTATSRSIESDHSLVIQPKEEPAPEITKPVSISKLISSNEERPPTPLKKTKMKPPKPKTENTKSSEMPQMPYVSATGNGPDGKTVHGFLHRYSKSEISIVCICHGSTFSPAEFVQHAGGTDVSQPLRHITVIPSAFG